MLRTDGRTGVGARDAYASQKGRVRERQEYLSEMQFSRERVAKHFEVARDESIICRTVKLTLLRFDLATSHTFATC